jgi:hypothetical protein
VTPEQKKRIDMAMQELRESLHWVDAEGMEYGKTKVVSFYRALDGRIATEKGKGSAKAAVTGLLFLALIAPLMLGGCAGKRRRVEMVAAGVLMGKVSAYREAARSVGVAESTTTARAVLEIKAKVADTRLIGLTGADYDSLLKMMGGAK